MRAEIISIGTELLLGDIINTNTPFLSKKLSEIGIDVFHTSVVGDNPGRLSSAIDSASCRAEIVITTGGLGPTVDDVTTATLARLLGKKLVMDRTVLAGVKGYFRSKGARFPEESLRQAYVPEGIRLILNKVGTAPGMIARYADAVIICLPGPPRELEPMVERSVIPYLKTLSKNASVIISRTVKIAGLAESVVDGRVRDLLNMKPPTTVGIYAKHGQVELKIMSKAPCRKTALSCIDTVARKIRSRLGNHILGFDEETLESVTGKLLAGKRLTLATAESCTGGLISSRITDIPGSSKYFLMGVVAYSNRAKENILGVPPETLKKYGAVSRNTAIAMAEGIRMISGSSIGLGITGIAGPGGGTKKKPVGLVYAALSSAKGNDVRQLRLKGSRAEIKFQASQAALNMVRQFVYR